MPFIFLIFAIFNINLEASTVRSSSLSAPVAFASNLVSDISLRIVSDRPAGDGTSETDPFKIYVPMGGTGGAGAGLEQRNQLTLSPRTYIPINPGAGSSYVLFQLSLTNTSLNTETLKAAIKNYGSSTSYKIIDLKYVHTVPANSSSTVDSVFDIANICVLTTLDCTKINLAVTATGANYGEFIVYYFLTSSSVYTVDSDMTPSSESGGIFVKYHFSDQLPQGSLVINKVYNGDSRAFIDFSGGENISKMGDKVHQTMIYKNTGTQVAGGTIGGTVGGIDNIHSLVAPTYNGLLDIQNLANNTDYYFSVALVNKFSFHNPLSATALAHPEPIEALLKKQACFLLTAGFAGNHPVVEYFRYIRDHYLLNYSLGKILVNTYYEWAPKYAQDILARPWLSAGIRAVAQSLYFILHHMILVGPAFFALTVLYKKRRRAAQL